LPESMRELVRNRIERQFNQLKPSATCPANDFEGH
jgi:hypothetical protein